MAIVFQNNKYNITIDSNKIIGVMGDFESFFSSLDGDDVYYIEKRVSVSNKKVYKLLDINDKVTKNILNELGFDELLLNQRINELSHSEQTILKYILMVLSNKKIIIVDEPFMDLDYDNKKKIILLLNRLAKNKKTIIIGSMDSNIIYSLCKKVLFISDKDYYYDDILAFKNKKILKKYHIDMPYLVEFVELAKDKKIKLKYSQDIRDLIKDVYRNVSKK